MALSLLSATVLPCVDDPGELHAEKLLSTAQHNNNARRVEYDSQLVMMAWNVCSQGG